MSLRILIVIKLIMLCQHFIIVQILITLKINVSLNSYIFDKIMSSIQTIGYKNNHYFIHVTMVNWTLQVIRSIRYVYRDIPTCTNLVGTMNKIRCFV